MSEKITLPESSAPPQRDYPAVVSGLFRAAKARTQDVLAEEASHSDFIYAETEPWPLVGPPPETVHTGTGEAQPAAMRYFLVEDHQQHVKHVGEVLEVHVPVDSEGDNDSALLWLAAGIDLSKARDGRDPWILVKHLLAPGVHRTALFTPERWVIYRDRNFHPRGHGYSKDIRRDFPSYISKKLMNFEPTVIRPSGLDPESPDSLN
jgi:hypothetical protein